ncbi:MAG TPA: hypothetical protein VKG25_01370 [Bryobacteraceae bacterium]|nr:hypothetical protein [Bryobacteraceae bacterium]
MLPCLRLLVGSPFSCVLLLTASASLFGQHSTNPVLLVNGFQATCPDGGAFGTFGSLGVFLLEDGAASVDYFDVCDAPDATIQSLAGLLTARIQAYPGSVDVIAHSMGGLVVRSYLQGWTANPYLAPPTNPKIRKLVLLGTPNSGVSNNFASLSSLFAPWSSTQVEEMQFASPFLWQLGTWNQLYDDLRGVDTLAIAGTAGLNPDGVPWDGLVDVASASIDFAETSGVFTRAVPYCHAALGICPPGSTLIASVPDRSHLSYQLLRSFLDGNARWMELAPPASSVSSTGGVQFALSDSNGNAYYANQLSSVSLGPYPLSNPLAFCPVWFNNNSAAGIKLNLGFDLPGQQFNLAGISVPSGGFIFLPSKFPPQMTFVTSSAARPPGALSVAPDSLVSIYGAGLASGTAQASSVQLPYQLAGASLTLAGLPVQLLYVSTGQINALIPNVAPGLYSLVLTTPQGKHSINLMVDPIVPTLFALDDNSAAALHASTGQVVTTSNPAAVGEYISFFGTGLGPTSITNGLNVAQTMPAVSIGGKTATVTFAGRAPGFAGLDQINVQIPSGLQPGSLPVLITSGNRVGNTVLLAAQ